MNTSAPAKTVEPTDKSAPKRRLGAMLVEQGVLSEDQLRIGLIELKSSKKPLGAILIELGFVTDSIIRDALSENTGQRSVDLSNAVLDAKSIQIVPQDLARRYTILPLSFDASAKHLTLAMADTFNIVALDQVRALNGGDLQITPRDRNRPNGF
jgi:type IV pilus assembly protein PilB